MRRPLAMAFALTVACSATADDCLDCEISVRSVLSFGDEDGEGALPKPPRVAPAPAGSWMVTLWGGSTDGLPRIFDRSGRFLATVGAVGAGPSEFQVPGAMIRSGDSVFVFDNGLLRAQVVLPPRTIVRTVPWSAPPSEIIELRDGTFVQSRSGDGSGYALQHVSRAGVVLAAFGARARARFEVNAERLALSPDGSFWSVPLRRELKLQHWTRPGVLSAEVIVETPLYPPYEQFQSADESRPPSPTVVGIWIDSTSAWLALEVADANWRDGYGAVAVGEAGRRYLPLSNPDRAFDTLILRVDHSDGSVLAERRLDSWLPQLVMPEVLASHTETEDGWYRAHLWQIAARSRDR